MVSDRTSIFHMCIPSSKTFLRSRSNIKVTLLKKKRGGGGKEEKTLLQIGMSRKLPTPYKVCHWLVKSVMVPQGNTRGGPPSLWYGLGIASPTKKIFKFMNSS